jgi:hypothetical protein
LRIGKRSILQISVKCFTSDPTNHPRDASVASADSSLRRHSFAIWPIRRQRVLDIDDLRYLNDQRNLLPNKTVGITASIQMFVMAPDGRQCIAK